jgi:hypothetical protein
MEKRRFATWKSPAVMPEWYKEGVNNGWFKKRNNWGIKISR